ncbi:MULTISPECIES: DUF6376 family protein [Virgibacillus]|uniref:Lipoprotein n=2 Tax=Virgibacillus TaxID=84406 RepID=A0A024QF58_9BACI|nr:MULTISPECIES: DUF6376 family protein [Virgibacillus]EQB34942.1 hypothetical protein M948_17695 [Virgibacillus sp. CM-4]MYL42940.1 hypothetical protein [Virgibacillus massiliensis]GGJ70811.1 hypothetical protein GCM10007111_35500 [Virgibacillus kapii]CDQ40840.1 hypothetical protein BN990_03173 [Virgibacillus massiliensis]
MKKAIFILLSVLFIGSLTGCSFLEETTNSVNYVNETSDYINDLSEFANEATQLPEEELVIKLEGLQDTIKDFLTIEPPSLAEDIHQKLESQSQALLDATNGIIDQGEIAVEQFKESEVYQTMENIIEFQSQIEQLEL